MFRDKNFLSAAKTTADYFVSFKKANYLYYLLIAKVLNLVANMNKKGTIIMFINV